MPDIQRNEIIGMMEIVDQAVRIPRFAYPMYQGAPRPPIENYAAVRCKHSLNPGYDKQEYIECEGGLIFRTVGIRILTFDIMFIRDGNEIVDFDNAFYRPDVKAVMRKHGFAGPLLKSPTNLNNTDLETNWEIRKGITCQFNVIRSQESKIDRMSDAKVGGLFIADNKQIKIKSQ